MGKVWGFLMLFIVASTGAFAASNDNNVEWEGLFADQGPLFITPNEPNSATPVTLTLRVFKNDITSARIKYWDTAHQAFHWVSMAWFQNDATGVFDLWKGVIPASASLKYYRFQINDGSATVWLNAAGITAPEPSAGDFWIVPNFHTPEWAKQAIYYQIFPDRFNDGDPTNNLAFTSSKQVEPQNGSCPEGSYVYLGHCAYQHHSWNELPQRPNYDGDFFGGDLAGITTKISPYLRSTLGVTALYLNPIFQSPSNHKYDTQDYTQVDPHFGTNTDLQQLISTAHSNGMAVMLDGVFNHTSTFHRWFDQQHLYPTTGAAEAADSPWSDRYMFLHWPDTYCDWSGVTSMPKLNYGSVSLRDDIYRHQDSVLQTYLRAPYGADGWRFDVAGDLVTITNAQDCSGMDDHVIWQEIRSYIKGVSPEALILGEEWGKAAAWTNSKEWDAVMNYNGFNTPVSKWITCQDVHGDQAGQCLSVTDFDRWLRGVLSDYPRPTQLAMMNSLSTHDTARFLSRAGRDEWKMKLAIILQMTYVGAPAIYYGDETGTTGDRDPDNRRTFNWDTSTWNTTILDMYRRMIQVRKEVSAFRDGSFKTLLVDDSNNLYAYGRWNTAGLAIVILNNDTVGHGAAVPAYQLSIADGARLTDRLTGAQYTVSNGSITVPPTALLGHYGVVLVSDGAM